MTSFRITYKSGLSEVVPQNCLFDVLYTEYEDKLLDNGVPLPQEVEGWSELCSVGETYETEYFTIQCLGSTLREYLTTKLK